MNKTNLILIIIFILTSVHGFSQHDDHNDHETHHDSHIHSNHLAVVIGATSNLDHHSTDFTIGLDYEYRFDAMHNLLGTGFFGEYVATESGEIILGIPVFIHPAKGLKIIVAPILIMAENHDTHKQETHFGGRLGLGYDFHLGKLSIGPVINLDYSNTIALNYGLTVGLGF